MGQILHGSARTTEAVRRAIQHSQESLNVLAKQYGINPKTVSKWRKRDFVHDAPMGPSVPASTVLKPEEEAMCVAFRRHTLLPLDDCLYALQPTSSICRARPCIAVINVTASADCRMSKVISLQRRNLKTIRLAIFILMSRKFKRKKESFICSSLLTVHQSTLTPNCMSVPQR